MYLVLCFVLALLYNYSCYTELIFIVIIIIIITTTILLFFCYYYNFLDFGRCIPEEGIIIGIARITSNYLPANIKSTHRQLLDVMQGVSHLMEPEPRTQFKLCLLMYKGWRQTILDSSVDLSARTMLAVLSGLRSAATSSSRERRQSSATEHSPSQVI